MLQELHGYPMECGSGDTEIPATRARVTQAARQIDQQLQRNAIDVSESRPNQTRIFFAAPLAVTLRIETDGLTVSVLHI